MSHRPPAPGVVRLGCAVVLALATAAAARTSPPPCRPAEYAIAGEPVGTAASTTVEIGTRVGLGATCPLTGEVVRRATGRGVTRVRARWDSCPGLPGPVRFRGKIVDDCTHVVGRVRARGYRRRLEALRSDCGDGVLEAVPPPVPYVGTSASLAAHVLPPWFDDAKFGIMIHWGIFTIPAWAETVIDPADWLVGTRLLEPPDYGREWFTHIPYVEWYPNTILIDGSPAQLHHAATYGAGFPYEDFRPAFESAAVAWSGETWADLFRESGARYVVLVTKHHDGFALWPTAVPHPTRPGWNMARDVVGELSAAVRRRCMRMGLYYSGGLDWSVQPGPITNSIDVLTVAPQTPEYVAYANGQWRELVARYRPAVMWNDLGYPSAAGVLGLMADYYNAVPDGVINDRFTVIPGLVHSDYSTPEFSVVTGISPRKFETVRGMGRGFGYNQNETDADLESAEGLIHLLADVVSKNGNLLLNVGPLADGTIPAAQADRLRAMGAWLGVNGAAVFGTRPWSRPAGVTADGTPVRFTVGGDGALHAIVLGPLPVGSVTLRDVPVAPSAARLLGSPGVLTVARDGADLRITLRATPPASAAHVFAIGP